MPASNEKVTNRPLSGIELAEIIKRDVANILARDGMFSINIGYRRVSYDVRISLHLDNPSYPEHVSSTLSRPASVQQVQAEQQLAAIELSPLKAPLTEESTVVALEMSRKIESPNVARVENDLPLKVTVRENGIPTEKDIKFVGDMPDPADVGNVATEVRDVSDAQGRAWGAPVNTVKAKGAGKGKGKP